MSPDDGRERLLNAMESLATSAAPIQQRVRGAGEAIVHLQASDFTDPADGELFREIIDSLTAVGDPGHDGDLELTALAMSEEEALRIARMIALLHRRVFPW